MCGKPGHFVDKCYHHFDRNFQRTPTPSQKFGNILAIPQSDSRAFLAFLSDSNEAYMSDIGSVQGAHYSHFS